MGKGKNRKPFIDKSKATTYNLLYRASEVTVEGEDAGPERELVETSRRVGLGRPDVEAAAAAASSSGSRYPPGHPLAMLEEPPLDNMTEERRRELIELGFPDDGYDYLKHMRAPGRGGRANLEGPGPASESSPGPSVFVPATVRSQLEDDARVYDASRLTIHQPAADETSAVQAMGGVSAFSRQREHIRQTEQVEVAAMEDLLSDPQFEDAEGDLEDDFVVAATQGEDEEAAAGAAAAAYGSSDSEDGSAPSEASSQSRSDWAAEAGAARSQFDAKPGSIASTYWRPERSDRKNLLSVVDERFEHMALDYDEDDIGSLDEEDPEAQGTESLDAYGGLMDEFLATHEGALPAPGEQAAPHGVAYRSTADIARGGAGPDAAAAAKTIEQAKRLAQEEAPAGAATQRQPQEYELYAEPARERWDVESVLSLRSNLDNHPASISEPQSGRRPRQQVLGASADGMIPLGRSGIPTPSTYSRAGLGRGGVRRLSGMRHLADSGSNEGSHSSEDGASIATSMMTVARRKDETADEKKARKHVVKESRRAARAAKKELKGQFKQEYKRQVRAMAAPAPAAVSLP